ncbi:MAG: hypothetical protein KOO63_12550 [Bacteroidales bacterium]|nr:hypothetical protein [Candidatus Latescibacterota bacterium]
MNNLLNEIFGNGLNEIGEALQAAAVLWVFPVYIFILFAIGTYLFYLGRRLRIEQEQDIDLLLDEFPSLNARYGDIGSDFEGKSGSSAEPDKDEEPGVIIEEDDNPENAEIDRDIEEVTGIGSGNGQPLNQDNNIEDNDSETDKRFSSAGLRDKEGMWQIAVHDAPLLVISLIIVAVIYAVISLFIERAVGADPLSLLLQRTPAGPIPEPISRFLFGSRSFFLPMVLYTILGGILLVILPRQVYRIFNLDWLHVEPFSRRSRIARRTWRVLCFVNYNRLDGSTKKWLVILVPVYVLFLLVSDLLAIFFSLYLPPAFLAAAHLFPVVLPRMFAPVWGSRIDFTRSPMKTGRKIEVEKLPEFLSDKRYLGTGGDDSAIKYRETIHQNAGNAVPVPDAELSDRMKDSLELFGRRDIEAFLCHALEKLLSEKLSLVVNGPRGSGREVVGILCSIEAAFRGGSSLILVRNADQAAKLIRRLEAFSNHYPAVQCFNIEYAGSEHLFEVKGTADKIDILVADLGSFDRIADHENRLSLFWTRMDLAIIFETDESSPLIKAEIPFIIKRMTSLAGKQPADLPVMVSVLDGAREDQRSFNRLLSREFVELPLGYAGGSRIDLMTMGNRGRDSLNFKDDLDLLTRFGSGMADAGYEKFYLSIGPRAKANLDSLDLARWTTRAEEFAEESVVVSLVRLLPETFFTQVSEIRELSRACTTGHHICFMMPPRDGFEQWLHDHLGEFLQYRHNQVSPVLLPGIDNPILNRKQMTRLILEKPQPVDRIAELFGKRALEDLLISLKAECKGKEEQPVQIINDPVYGKTFSYRRDTGYAIPVTRTVDGAVDDPDHDIPPIEVRCIELGIRRKIDPQRQLSILWPGRIFSLNGERVRVKGLPIKGVLECYPEPEDLRTLKIRQIFILENKDITLASDHIFSEEGIGIYRTRMKIKEVILGYRTWRGQDLIEESLYGIEGQITSEMEVDASVLFFPGLDSESAHLIAHVLKRYLKMVCLDTEDVIDVTHNCFKPFSRGVAENLYYDVTIIDNVPGGLGVCNMIEPVLIRKIAALIVSMHEEGAEWYRIQDCFFPRLGKFDHLPPDPSPEMDITIADRVVEYFKKVVLARDPEADEEPLDFGCNLWIDGSEDEETMEGIETALGKEVTEYSSDTEADGSEWSDPKSELMSKVYADANRIGRPGKGK